MSAAKSVSHLLAVMQKKAELQNALTVSPGIEKSAFLYSLHTK
jgi:hypothetical protein